MRTEDGSSHGGRLVRAGSIDLTIVVASYETRELTLACLDAIERARVYRPELVVETIVVDNGSNDGSPQAIARHHPDVHLFASVRNRGFSAAINLGLRAARGRHVLLLNSDVEIEPDVLARGIGWLDEKPDFGVLGVALRHADGRAQRSVHPLPDLQTELLPDFILRLIRPRGDLARAASHGRGQAGDGQGGPIEVEAVRGAVFFVRGLLLEKVGLFDESYFFFLEETDYCRRVAEEGYRVGHCQEISATHRIGSSSKIRAPMATRIEYHRSLYRYLARQCGGGVVRLARSLRTLRNVFSVLGLAMLALLASASPHSPRSIRARARLAERAGLLLWHLRGCPSEPRMVDAIRSDWAIRGGEAE